MQRGLPSQTLTFGPSTSNADLPDWLLLDLLAPALQDTLQPVPAPLSYLHGTMGKININALINPLYPNPIPTRTLPMQALFKNMVPDSQLMQLAKNVITHNLSGREWGAPGQYDYIGELCEVAGVADSGNTNWQKEVIIRNLANLLTTQSNTFKDLRLGAGGQCPKKGGQHELRGRRDGRHGDHRRREAPGVSDRAECLAGSGRGARQRACDRRRLRPACGVADRAAGHFAVGGRGDAERHLGTRIDVGVVRRAG